MMEFDIASIRELVASPGIDTRQWISYGVVTDPGDGSSFIEFDEDDYKQPLVLVTLQPSALVLPCRVLQSVAGQGEGEWYPFVSGDEVLVAVPEGNEKSGAVILGRLSNSLDSFPTRVAGSDVNANNFGFRRMRAPYVLETAGGFTIRHATSGAFISITQTGDLVLSNGESGVMRLGAAAQGFQSSDGATVIQIDEGAGSALVQAGSSVLRLEREADSYLNTRGPLRVSAGGAAPVQHNVSLEQVLLLLSALVPKLPFTVPPAPGPIMDSLLAAALATVPNLPLSPIVTGAMSVALAAPQNPTASQFGAGSPTLLVG